MNSEYMAQMRQSLHVDPAFYEKRCMDFKVIREMFDYQTKRFGERTSIYYRAEGKEMTASFTQLRKDVYSLGAWLWEQGYHRRNIAIAAKNSYPYAALLFALLGSDNTAVLLNPGMPSEAIGNMLELVDTDVVFCDSDIAEKIPDGKIIWHLDEILRCAQQTDWENSSYADYSPKPEDIAVLLFSSGTTGSAKAVMLSQGAISASLCSSMRISPHITDSVLLLPLFHAMGFTTFLNDISLGCGIYLNTDIRRMLADISLVKPAVLAMVPIQLELLYKMMVMTSPKELRKALGERLNMIYVGGSVFKDEVIKGLAQAGICVCGGYGMTEIQIVTMPTEKHCSYMSSGAPKDNVEIRIDHPDATGKGEILIRGETIFSGYYGDPDATKALMPDGWIHSGDIGYFDNDGCLFVTGRIKNLIILSTGENVSPEELENQLLRSSMVAECRVFEWEDAICAEIFPNEACVAQTDLADKLKALIKELNSRYPGTYHITKAFLRKEPLKKTAIGKIRRDVLPSIEKRIF